MSNLLSELDAVAGLAELATPGEWRTEYRKTTRGYAQEVFDQSGATIASMAWHALPLSDTTTTTDRVPNAQFIAAVANLFRTHHAEIAADTKDAARYRWLRDVWGGWMVLGGKMRADIRTPLWSGEWGSFDEAIDDMMSAREGE